MAPNDTYPNPNTNSSTSSNLNPITEVPAPPAPKKHKGVRCRTSGGYVAEIRHAKGRTWLGTFVTADEAAFAYDLAAQKLKGTTYNFNVGADNQIITTIDPAKQAAIGKKIEEKLRANPRSSADNASQRAETSHKRKWTRKSGNEEFRREPNARKKREVEKKQRDVDLEGFL